MVALVTAHLFSPKSDKLIIESANLVYVVVFGGGVRRTEGVIIPIKGKGEWVNAEE